MIIGVNNWSIITGWFFLLVLTYLLDDLFVFMKDGKLGNRLGLNGCWVADNKFGMSLTNLDGLLSSEFEFPCELVFWPLLKK